MRCNSRPNALIWEDVCRGALVGGEAGIAAGAGPLVGSTGDSFRLAWMQAAIWLMSRLDTSSITPRPNWATRPATWYSVTIVTREVSPSAVTDISALARAEPGPVVSRPSADSVPLRSASLRSDILAVPLYATVMGPTLTLTLPLKVLSSTTSVSSAPGTQPTILLTSRR